MTRQDPMPITGAQGAAVLPRHLTDLADALSAALLAGTGMRFACLPELHPPLTPPDGDVVARIRTGVLRAYRAPARRWTRLTLTRRSGARADDPAPPCDALW